MCSISLSIYFYYLLELSVNILTTYHKQFFILRKHFWIRFWLKWADYRRPCKIVGWFIVSRTYTQQKIIQKACKGKKEGEKISSSETSFYIRINETWLVGLNSINCWLKLKYVLCISTNSSLDHCKYPQVLRTGIFRTHSTFCYTFIDNYIFLEISCALYFIALWVKSNYFIHNKAISLIYTVFLSNSACLFQYRIIVNFKPWGILL